MEKIDNLIEHFNSENKVLQLILNDNIFNTVLKNETKYSEMDFYFDLYNKNHSTIVNNLRNIIYDYKEKIKILHNINDGVLNYNKFYKQASKMVNNLVIDSYGRYYLPFISNENIVMIVVFEIKKIGNDDIIFCKIRTAGKYQFRSHKHIQFTTIPFFKEMKELKSKFKNKNIKDVILIAPQLFSQIYNTKIKHYEKNI